MNKTEEARVQVALVEDQVMVAELLAAHLNGLIDINVLLTASDGLELKTKLDPDNLPDVLLLDVQLPGLDGYGCVEWLNDEHPTVKIIVLSGFENADMVARMQVLGVKNFFFKRDGYLELERAILEVAAGGTYRNPRVKRASAYDPDLLNLTELLAQLHARRYEFYGLICEDISYREIAERMGFSLASVKRYADVARRQFGVSNRSALVARLYASGHVPPPHR